MTHANLYSLPPLGYIKITGKMAQKSQTVRFTVASCDTIASVKLGIEKKGKARGFPPAVEQILTYRRKVLEDRRTLMHYGVQGLRHILVTVASSATNTAA